MGYLAYILVELFQQDQLDLWGCNPSVALLQYNQNQLIHSSFILLVIGGVPSAFLLLLQVFVEYHLLVTAIQGFNRLGWSFRLYLLILVFKLGLAFQSYNLVEHDVSLHLRVDTWE